MSETLLHPIRPLRVQIEAWIRSRLWAQVVAGLVLGVIVGYALGPDLGWVALDTAENLGKWLALPGNLFLGMISTALIPLVVGSIIQGLNGPQSAEELRSVGFRFLVYVLLTTTAAATLGIALAKQVRPGDFLAVDTPPDTVASALEPAEQDVGAVSVPDAILGGRNPVRFLASVADPLILAFSTSSSAAVMPPSIDTAVNLAGDLVACVLLSPRRERAPKEERDDMST